MKWKGGNDPIKSLNADPLGKGNLLRGIESKTWKLPNFNLFTYVLTQFIT
jgi:hypothetical protein